MSRVAALFIAVALFALPVWAGYWNGPGWYQMWESNEGFNGIVDKNGGPYASKQECERMLPKDGDEYMYVCEYFGSRPESDE
jgi:hypothetical protein